MIKTYAEWSISTTIKDVTELCKKSWETIVEIAKSEVNDKLCENYLILRKKNAQQFKLKM